MNPVRIFARWLYGRTQAQVSHECCGDCLETYADTLDGWLQHRYSCQPKSFLREAVAQLDDETPDMPRLADRLRWSKWVRLTYSGDALKLPPATPPGIPLAPPPTRAPG